MQNAHTHREGKGEKTETSEVRTCPAVLASRTVVRQIFFAGSANNLHTFCASISMHNSRVLSLSLSPSLSVHLSGLACLLLVPFGTIEGLTVDIRESLLDCQSIQVHKTHSRVGVLVALPFFVFLSRSGEGQRNLGRQERERERVPEAPERGNQQPNRLCYETVGPARAKTAVCIPPPTPAV